MEVTVDWQGQVKFKAMNPAQHTVSLDGPPEYGGEDGGFRPMEMILVGLGGCASFDLIHFLKKAREKVTHCHVVVKATRADAVPAVFESIHLQYHLKGHQLNRAKVARMLQLSHEKYCSAAVMLKKAGVLMTSDFQIEEVEDEC